jgi:DNA-binding CsgD family transcriptional regulator
MFRIKACIATSLFIIAQFACLSYAQTIAYPFGKWVKLLSVHNDSVKSVAFNDVVSALDKKDSSVVSSALNELEKKGSDAGKYFKVRFKLLKAVCLLNLKRSKASVQISQLLHEAVLDAYEINDEDLAANISWMYGEIMHDLGKIEPAAMYCLNAMETWDRKHIEKSAFEYFLLGEILYHTRDYEKSIYYNKRSIKEEKDTSAEIRANVMSRWNTVALAWQKMNKFDSAFFYYGIAMKMANGLNREVWKGIISGNKGQIYFQLKKYDTAKVLLTYDYVTSKKFREWDNAANSLQWVARINLLRGKKDSALIQVKEAMQLLDKKFYVDYYLNICYTAAEVYRALGNRDSAYKYTQLYTSLYDSTESAIASSRLEVSQIKLDNLRNFLIIQNLQKEKNAAAQQRNFIIAASIMFVVILVLILNRQKQKLKYNQQLALQQKIAAEAEVSAAREQLDMFTQNIREKTKLIEQLQQQVNNKTLTLEQQQQITELSQYTILTEDDWEKFKTLFEKIYPGFFLKLRETVSDITTAEQRMAALTRLHFSTKQIASILGISPDSVHKTRQRLRNRLNFTTATSVEEFLSGL